MSPTLHEQIAQLKQTMAEMEAQRALLGDEVVDAALVPLRNRLSDLQTQVEPPTEKRREVPRRQRKLVTLLFMDVAGSTQMTRHLDPEDTMEIMDNALRLLADPVQSHGGHVTRFMGDGFMAVFGDPLAREDDPEQAVRAGLEIQAVAQSLAQELGSQWDIQGFKVRVGINTGLAALGGYTEAEDTVMGRPVNLAARIESAAPPGGVLISHNTYRHVRGVFDVKPQESILAKGFDEPLPVYLVQRVRPRAFRVPMLGVEGVETRMVGRETELKCLQDALFTAMEEGEGQIITIAGEAGVGKSRLLYEFQNWIELLPPPSVRFFQGRGRQESQGQPYALLRDLFAFRFQILEDDRAAEARRKIEQGFAEVFGEGEAAQLRAHLLGQLLGFDFSASLHLKGVLNDPEQLRNRGLIYLNEYFQMASSIRPTVVFLEDIHWGDDSSLDAVNRLGERTPELSLLIICAARHSLFERRPYWGEGQTHHICLELRPLSRRESRQLVAEILKLADEVPAQLRELVVNGAEGNPFYVEELIKMLVEDGVILTGEETWRVEPQRLAEVEVPSTLAGVLQARLDSLPPQERRVLQQASVVGRLFWDRLVAHIQAEGGDGGDPQLVPVALSALRGRELIYRREESAFAGAVEYLFKHELLREVTYESVLKRLRQVYHGLVGEWLISQCGDRLAEYSGLIAEHLLLAGRREQAGEYFTQAGKFALASYANSEAEGYFRQALALSPSDAERADLMSGLGQAVGRPGRLEEGTQILRQAIHLYRELGDIDGMADVHARLSLLLWLIDHVDAWNLCQEGLELLKGAPDSPGYARLLAEAGRTAYFRNVSDQAISLCRQAVAMAKRLGDVEVQAETNITLAFLTEDYEEGIDILEEMIALTEKERMLRTAARAHQNLGEFLNACLIDIKSAQQHNLRAAEIRRQIGDIEALMHVLGNVYRCLADLGELKSLEDWLVEFLKGCNISESRIRELLRYNCKHLLLARGEWSLAMETIRVNLEKRRQVGDLEEIAVNNLHLVNAILEFNRFGDLEELTEAETALEENIDIDWYSVQSLYLLAIVSARQGRLGEARERLARANRDLPQSQREANIYRELRSKVEFELASAEGRWPKAVVACEASIKIFQDSGHRWGYARRLIDLGDALVGRDEAGDLERARHAYQQALDLFTEMGAPGYVQVLEERLAKFVAPTV